MILTREQFARHVELLEENVYEVPSAIFLHDAAQRAEIDKLTALCFKAAAWMRCAIADFEDQGVPQVRGRTVVEQIDALSPKQEEISSEEEKETEGWVFKPRNFNDKSVCPHSCFMCGSVLKVHIGSTLKCPLQGRSPHG